jgi:hypothetical protein
MKTVNRWYAIYIDAAIFPAGAMGVHGFSGALAVTANLALPINRSHDPGGNLPGINHGKSTS